MNDKAIEMQAEALEHCAAAIAQRLTDLAERVRQAGTEFSWVAAGKAHKTRTMSKVAADIVNDYTPGTGQVGANLWTLVTDAGELDRQMQRDAAQPSDAAMADI